MKTIIKDCWNEDMIEYDNKENTITALKDCRVSLFGHIMLQGKEDSQPLAFKFDTEELK